MAGPTIDVSANVGGAQREFDKIAAAINRLGREVAQAAKVKFEPVDADAALHDLKLVEQQFEQLKRVSRSLRDSLKATGQLDAPFHGIDWARLRSNPGQAQRMRESAYRYVTSGTGWQLGAGDHGGQPPGGAGFSFSGISEAVRSGLRNFFGGVGGGAGQIGGGALGGAASGGGFSMGGLLRGGLFGAAAFGAYKLGSAVSEGYESAKAQNIDLDTLKRQMGDLEVSFKGLQTVASEAAEGLGISSSEAAKLGLEFNRLAGGVEDGTDLMRELRGGVGFGRSFGLDPNQSVAFFAQMRHLTKGDEQSNRRLALLIGETINRSGMNARAGEVLQAIQGFASATSRLALALPNVEGYAGAYAGLLGTKTPGLTDEVAAAMLGAANSSMQRMGSAGEAGMNFTMAAFGATGPKLNPIQAGILAEGGLFGTRDRMLGPNSAYGRYMAAHGRDVSGLVGMSGATNFEAVRAQLDRMGGDPNLKLDAAKRYFGLASYNQAAALMTMRPQEIGGLERLLAQNGLKVGDINETGIQALAKIGGASGMGDLDAVYASMRARTGRGALSAGEVSALDAARGQGFDAFRDALVKIAASKDQEETEGAKTRQQLKDIESATTAVGQLLVGPMNTMRDALLVIANKGGPKSLRRRAADLEKGEIDASYATGLADLDGRIKYAEGERPSALALMPGGIGGRARESAAGWDREIARLTAERAELERKRDAEKAAVDRRLADEESAERRLREERARIDAPPVPTGKQQFIDAHRKGAEAAARDLDTKPEFLLAQAGLETGWGKSVIPGTNNLGNIKAGSSWNGATRRAYDKTEGSNDPYRVYPTPDEYWADYVTLMKRRYPGVIGAKDATQFARGLKSGGYATDPDYERKLAGVIGGMPEMTPMPAGAPSGRGFGPDKQQFAIDVSLTGQLLDAQQRPVPLDITASPRFGTPRPQGGLNG